MYKEASKINSFLKTIKIPSNRILIQYYTLNSWPFYTTTATVSDCIQANHLKSPSLDRADRKMSEISLALLKTHQNITRPDVEVKPPALDMKGLDIVR